MARFALGRGYRLRVTVNAKHILGNLPGSVIIGAIEEIPERFARFFAYLGFQSHSFRRSGTGCRGR
jgi:hypothetical protein